MKLIWRARRARESRDERGATLIEAAIMLPLFFFLVFGILEFGFAFRNYLTVANGTREGARMATIVGNQADADFRILEGIESAMSAMNEDDIIRIVVWHASSSDDTVSSGCLDGVASNDLGEECNVYTPASFAVALDQFDCGGPGTAPDDSWCPANRKTATTGTFGPPDYVGITIQVEYDYITGLFPGDGMVFTDTTIMRIEPRSVA
jgi:hypothetical protein